MLPDTSITPLMCRGTYSFYLHFPENSSVVHAKMGILTLFTQSEGGKLSVIFKQITVPLSF